MLPGGGLLHAQTATIEYAENGTGPVATFTATDPEGVTPIAWSLADDTIDGVETADIADNGSFTIDKDGMLKFSSPPDYEANESGGGDDDNDNTYHVVVVAADAAGNQGYRKVTVKVTEVAETGKVTWTVDPSIESDVNANDPADGEMPIMQFQVGAVLTASATDGDVPTKDVTERFQWYRSSSKTAMGTAIDGQTSSGYTVTTEDVGMYLRVEAFYNVGAGREESASLTSDYSVLASRSSNDAPEFSPNTVTREVSEGDKGMTVGAPVTATDDITNALNYTLGGDDEDRFEIDQKTGQIKTKVDLDREGASAASASALGSCSNATSGTPDPECTVTVTATDSAGAASTVATVTINITNVDEKPTFSTTAPATGMKMISRDEGMTALADADADVTYSATDPEDRNLTYHLMGPDGAKFQLTSGTNGGVLSFRMKPDYEMPTDANEDNVYEVTVRASDGATHTDHMVMVTVTDADEAPTVMGKDSVDYAENGEGVVATFTATDPEGVTPIAWSLADDTIDGVETADIADNGSFTIDKDGMLKFSSPPDYEANESGGGDDDNDNTYHVVVVAADAAGNQGYRKVTVKVTEVAETGKVTWTVDPSIESDVNANDPADGEMPIMQFQVGAVLTASATDGDVSGATKGVTNNVSWRWSRGGTAIDGQTSSGYTVTTEDVDKRLRVVVAYNVGAGREESASLTSDYSVLASRSSNDAPEFSPNTVTREVSEGDKGMTVGAPVTATDDITNALNYTLGGDDEDRFEIDQKTGQIKTKVDLDREGASAASASALGSCSNATSGTPDPECTVTVTATDSAGAASTVATVTINITNVDEKPTFSTTAPATGMKMISRDEGMTALADADADVTYSATDPENIQVNLTLMGDDAAKFSLSAGGVLSFRMKPDYEMPTDANEDNVYEVTVRASDGAMHTDHMVMVTVTDADEAPMISAGPSIRGQSSISYAENGTDDVGSYEAAGLEAGASVRWSLSGDDAGEFNIRGGVLTFASPPDFEDPADANSDNVYMVTVRAGAATLAVAITVTDEDEMVVVPGDSLLERYDDDRSGRIDRDEVIAAIDDYLFGVGDEKLTRPQVIEVIDLYLFGG